MERKLIGICDDQSDSACVLAAMVAELLGEKRMEYQIQCYGSGEELLRHAGQLAIVFLEMEMPDMDGIETGGLLKRRNPGCRLIIDANIGHRYKEAFRINAFRFVTKPFETEEIREALFAAMDSFMGMGILELYQARNEYDVRQKDICYIQAFNGYAEFVVGKQRMRKEISLTALEKSLDSVLFYRINRQIVVNLSRITRYRNGCVYVNGESLSVSRRNRKEFEQRYMEFNLRYKRGQ